VRFRAARADSASPRLVWQAASLLLEYPGVDFDRRLDAADRIVAHLPARHRDPLGGLVAQLRRDDRYAAAERYVETFDLRRRATLYLTYWTAGDTRNRGREMLAFIEAYRAAGMVAPAGEAPDHLAVVLEFAATVDPRAGGELLAGHSVPIRTIARALTEAQSPYAGVLDAVSATLPAPSERDEQRAQRLAAQGPPAESVGLAPFTLTVPPRREGVS
jgi:nitrate reductase molybdenum cofactor assembly chaperone NarJ/NarW